MTAPTRPAAPLASPPPHEPGDHRVRSYVPGVATVVLAAALIGAFFLGLYLVRGFTLPIGWDTARYITAANLVGDEGLRGVEDLSPPPTNVLSSRVGFSVSALSFSSLLRVSIFKLAAILPAVAAVALALAAATFASTSLRWRSWEAAAVGMVVGLSPTVIRLIAPETYTENLLAAAPLLAALALVVSPAPLAGRTLVAAIVLLLAGGLSHGPSFAVVAGAVALAAAWFAPRSWRAWRRGEPLLGTPAGSLGLLLGGAGLFTGAIQLGLLGTAPDKFRIGRGALAHKLRSDLSLYRFGLTVPIAALGGAAFLGAARGRPVAASTGGPEAAEAEARPLRDRVTLALVLLGGWTLITAAGFAVFLAGKASPAHRFLAFLLPLPLLTGVGIVAVGRLAARAAGRTLGAAVVAAGLVASAVLGFHILYVQLPFERQVQWMDPGKMRDAANAAAYLEEAQVPPTTPLVFVVDDRGPQPAAYVPLMANMIRSVLPAARIERAYMYVGEPERYLAGQPTLIEDRNFYNGNSRRFFRAVEPVLARPHVALLLSSFNGAYGAFVQEHQELIVAPNVAVLRGPLLPRPMGDAVRPSAPRGVFQGSALGVAVLGALGLIGLGWGVALFPRALRLFEVLALSPAMGLASLILAGVVVDTAGFRLAGLGGIAAVVLAGVAGWAAGIIRLRREGLDLFGPR